MVIILQMELCFAMAATANQKEYHLVVELAMPNRTGFLVVKLGVIQREMAELILTMFDPSLISQDLILASLKRFREVINTTLPIVSLCS